MKKPIFHRVGDRPLVIPYSIGGLAEGESVIDGTLKIFNHTTLLSMIPLTIHLSSLTNQPLLSFVVEDEVLQTLEALQMIDPGQVRPLDYHFTFETEIRTSAGHILHGSAPLTLTRN